MPPSPHSTTFTFPHSIPSLFTLYTPPPSLHIPPSSLCPPPVLSLSHKSQSFIVSETVRAEPLDLFLSMLLMNGFQGQLYLLYSVQPQGRI